MRMPTPDAATIARRGAIAAQLRAIVGDAAVIESENERRPYETDGLTAYHALPLLVVLPSTTQEVSRIMAYCHRENLKIVPRGAGTSLSGGALPLEDGIILGLSKFNRILDVDFDNRCAVAQPGVTNLAITNAVADKGFYYAPDPSSQIACSIGGNVAENSGGVHCLKYGLTTNNVLGVEMVLIDGDGDPPGRQASRIRRLRSAGRDGGLGGTAGRRHRGHGAHLEQADHGAGGAGRDSPRTKAPASASPRSSAPASSPAAWR